jgi:general secretion pathway protein B
MSFILDALKKSDSERQGQNTPGIADVPHVIQRTSQPVWVWALSALLLVNVVVLIIVLLRPASMSRQAPPASESTSAAERPETVQPAPPATREVVTRQPVPVAEPDIDRGPPVAATAPVQPPVQTVTQSEPTPPSTVTASRQPGTRAASARADATPTVQDGLRSFDELRAAGVLQLSDLHLDIHVFSDQRNDRFVFVNMNKYKESATLDEGPVIREITPDGVILEHSGIQFLLPRE